MAAELSAQLATLARGRVDATRSKGRLRRLDACLAVLEDELERGQATLVEALALRLQSEQVDVHPGMMLIDALDVIFEEQQSCLATTAERTEAPTLAAHDRNQEINDPIVALNAKADPMSETEAKAITRQIKRDSAKLHVLLLRAHEGKAWLALGYRSWRQYVQREFGFSRSRSYEMLDQGRVYMALRETCRKGDVPMVSGRAAASLRPILPEVIHQLEERLRSDQLDQATIVAEVLNSSITASAPNYKRGEASDKPTQQLVDAGSPYDLENLIAGVEYFARMPANSNLLATVSDSTLMRLSKLPLAAKCLNDLTSEWSRRSALSIQRPQPMGLLLAEAG